MVTKLTQTQYGGKCDVRCHSKKQKGHNTEPSVPEDAVTVLIFHMKEFTKIKQRFNNIFL